MFYQGFANLSPIGVKEESMARPEPAWKRPSESYWLWVLCLVGLDYFSSLAYQPSISFEASGTYAPFATLALVAFTLFGALPVYCYVAGRSANGQGAIGLLERSLHGWLGKLLILVLLGFAAADFVVTRTLSVADAAVHVVHNPYPPWQATIQTLANAGENVRQLLPTGFANRLIPYWNARLVVAILLSILGFSFWAILRRGLTRRAIQIAVGVVVVYLSLNAIVLASALAYLNAHPNLVSDWWQSAIEGKGVASGTWSAGLAIAATSILAFPRVSLGLSEIGRAHV